MITNDSPGGAPLINVSPAAPLRGHAADKLVLIVICAGSFLSPLPLASINVAIPSLATELRADAVLLSWMPTVVLLGNFALMLPFGRLAENFGRKRIYSLGMVVTACASLGSFLSANIESILFFRFFQGGGSAMCFGSGMAILGNVFPPPRRGFALGLNATSLYFGITVAPVIGGYLTEYLSWRWVLLMPAPVASLLFVVITLCIKGEWRQEKHTAFDWSGALIFLLWTLTFVFGLAGLPGRLNGLFLLLSFPVLGLFIRHQSRTEHALIRVRLFRENRTFSLSLAAATLMYASGATQALLLSLYLQYINGLSPSSTAKIILVQTVAMVFLAPVAGKLSDRLEPGFISIAGCVAGGIGFAMLCQLDLQTQTSYICAAMAFTGIGFGLFTSPSHNSIMSSVGASDIGMAAVSVDLARVCGNLAGVSLVNLLVNILIGHHPITPDLYGHLLATVKWAMAITLGFVVLATLLTTASGRLRNKEEKK